MADVPPGVWRGLFWEILGWPQAAASQLAEQGNVGFRLDYLAMDAFIYVTETRLAGENGTSLDLAERVQRLAANYETAGYKDRARDLTRIVNLLEKRDAARAISEIKHFLDAAERRLTIQGAVTDVIRIFAETATDPSYDIDIMGKWGPILEAAAAVSEMTVAELNEAIGNYKTAKAGLTARENTGGATAQPRAKWDARTGDDLKLSPAEFIAKHYAAEMAAGTLHRGVIAREDKPLAVKLASWLRSNPMPEGIDIPTKPEWITRQAEAGKAEPAPRTEGQRIYDALRHRRYRALHVA